MRRFLEILQKVILIGGIIAIISATAPNTVYADPGGGGGDDGEEQLPPPEDPTP